MIITSFIDNQIVKEKFVTPGVTLPKTPPVVIFSCGQVNSWSSVGRHFCASLVDAENSPLKVIHEMHENKVVKTTYMKVPKNRKQPSISNLTTYDDFCRRIFRFVFGEAARRVVTFIHQSRARFQ